MWAMVGWWELGVVSLTLYGYAEPPTPMVPGADKVAICMRLPRMDFAGGGNNPCRRQHGRVVGIAASPATMPGDWPRATSPWPRASSSRSPMHAEFCGLRRAR
jgi:hypothetical protein